MKLPINSITNSVINNSKKTKLSIIQETIKTKDGPNLEQRNSIIESSQKLLKSKFDKFEFQKRFVEAKKNYTINIFLLFLQRHFWFNYFVFSRPV